MRILFALPGLHRFDRGAEVVFESVANEIALRGEHQVVLAGSGETRPGRAYEFIHVPAVSRYRFERWPKVPFLRNEFMYEELTFAAALATLRTLSTFDLTMTCSHPYTSLALRRPHFGKRRPAHIYVTQNSDWAAYGNGAEPRLFNCDGLICTNPLFLERNQQRWPRSTLIPNGIDPGRFCPGPQQKAALGLPTDRPIVLMVSALEPGKRVLEAMRAMADVPEAYMVVAGDGPLREEVDRLAADLLPGRFMRGTFRHDQMPDLYRSADLFLHTKIIESFGNVYIEALSCGVPVVAHDDEVTRWILGDYARLVDSTSPQALTAAIRETLQSPPPGDQASAWAHARYAWPVVAGKYANFFAEVMDSVAKQRTVR
jgi:glycosyltransferase involved in cell wall biosynthesis